MGNPVSELNAAVVSMLNEDEIKDIVTSEETSKTSVVESKGAEDAHTADGAKGFEANHPDDDGSKPQEASAKSAHTSAPAADDEIGAPATSDEYGLSAIGDESIATSDEN